MKKVPKERVPIKYTTEGHIDWQEQARLRRNHKHTVRKLTEQIKKG